MEDREPYITGGNVRDKYLTEAMGGCWHEPYMHRQGRYQERYATSTCDKCHIQGYAQNDFSTWEGFGKLWEWAIQQDWWESFALTSNHGVCDSNEGYIFINDNYICPEEFADAIYKYMKNNPCNL